MDSNSLKEFVWRLLWTVTALKSLFGGCYVYTVRALKILIVNVWYHD